MKFIIGEGVWSMLERFSYRGAIGLFFSDTLTGMAAYLLFAAFCFFAAVGLCATVKWLFTRKKKKRPYTYYSSEK